MIDRRSALAPLVSLALLAAPACEGGGRHHPPEAASTTSASDESTDADTTSPESAFAREVQPIFDAKCATCHGPIGAQLGLVLGPSSQIDPAEVAAALVDAPSTAAPLDLVEPGDPDASWLVRKIAGDFVGVACSGGCGGPMPPAGTTVTDDELAAITAWIADGAEVSP